jgi:iron complex transport system ATP-binding protein
MLHVPSDFDEDRPAHYLRTEARKLGVAGRFIGFMTGVRLRRVAIVCHAEPELVVIATAGVVSPTVPGRSPIAPARPGTINLCCLVNASLTPPALVESVKVITEAKTFALLERSIRTGENDVATGTATDAVAVGCTGLGQTLAYVGPVTAMGYALGHAVISAVQASLDGGNFIGRASREGSSS